MRKVNREAHTENPGKKNKMGMGDNYGSGVRNKTGRAIEIMARPVLSKTQLGKPPKSVA